MKISFVLLCALLAGKTKAGTTDCSSINNCPLHNFQSDIVTSQQMIDKNVFDARWIMLYYSEFDAHQSYGKCNFRWHSPDPQQVVRRELMCYNLDTMSCESFENKVTRTVDACGRVEENAVGATMDAKFYSQDLTQYFWYNSCYNYTETGSCEVGYLDLLVRDTRYPVIDGQQQELDLQGLPWQLISADLKKNFNMDISNNLMKFSWKKAECDFDGTLKTTSSALQSRGNLLVLLFILALTITF